MAKFSPIRQVWLVPPPADCGISVPAAKCLLRDASLPVAEAESWETAKFLSAFPPLFPEVRKCREPADEDPFNGGTLFNVAPSL
jgi:hypothetical protein